jgi:hypothetical protein
LEKLHGGGLGGIIIFYNIKYVVFLCKIAGVKKKQSQQNTDYIISIIHTHLFVPSSSHEICAQCINLQSQINHSVVP